MKKAVVSGSFDPITVGHLNIIKRATLLFDVVYVVVFINPEKEYLFSLEQRIEMIKKSCENLNNVIIDSYDGLCVDYCKNHDITYIVRGIRDSKDADYEIELANLNKNLNENIETIIFPADNLYSEISSTYVRNNLDMEEIDNICPWIKK